MNAADELERMAASMTNDAEAADTARLNEEDPQNRIWYAGMGAAYEDSSARLKRRAVELRAAPADYAVANDACDPLVVQLPSAEGWPADSVIRISSDSRAVLVRVPAKETIEIARHTKDGGGSAHRPQPKPAEVKAGQWWSADGDEPRRIVSVYPDGHDRCARAGAIDGVPIDYYVWEMLNSAAFLYHGDGPEPAK